MAIAKILLRLDVARFTGLRHLSTKPKFGLLFDIDGVIVRGKQVLSPVRESFKQLRGDNGKFRVPTLFVTNSGNSLCRQKAADLSEWIGFEVAESQVVLAHTPLQMFDYLHDKQVLISGQGPIKEIARELGFKKTTTVDELVRNFPCLDYVNVKKRNPVCGPIDPNFPRIEGIVMLSEPINWETPLQLMVDLLVTNGTPTGLPAAIPYPHIPVLACNMDLLWVSEAPIPRYGHGAFLLCLESLEDCARAVVRSSLEIQLVHRTLNTKQGLCFSPLSGCCCDEPRNSRDHPHCPSRKLRERAVRSVRSELCVLVGEAHRIRGAVANLRSPMPLLLDLEDREFADERILVASLSLPLVVLCRNACDCCFAHYSLKRISAEDKIIFLRGQPDPLTFSLLRRKDREKENSDLPRKRHSRALRRTVVRRIAC